MGQFNEELVKAGVMLAGEGLHPSSRAKRVRFSGVRRTVIDGPFAETKELLAGYWLWQVRSIDEVVEWVKRCPNPMPEEADIEIRPAFGPEDFGAELTPGLREQEDRLRTRRQSGVARCDCLRPVVTSNTLQHPLTTRLQKFGTNGVHR